VEAARQSIYAQLIVVADDAANRIEELLERVEKRGCGFVGNEHRRILALQAEYEQIATCMRNILARCRNQIVGDENGDVE